MGYFGSGKQEMEKRITLKLTRISIYQLCFAPFIFWQFFHKESKRIDFRRIVKGTKAIAVLQQHIFFIHCALNPYACIPIFNIP